MDIFAKKNPYYILDHKVINALVSLFIALKEWSGQYSVLV